jgi:hypothetical protein
MATPIEQAVGTSAYMLYDGTNSADVLAFVEDRYGNANPRIDSEADGVLVLYNDTNGWSTIRAGDHVGSEGEGVPAATWANMIIKA